jgi:UDP-N-acetylglucosamine 1-carboxyvinyltransferase
LEKFVIEGRFPLSGEVTPAGNKNAALPILAACLMTEEKIILRNLPDIEDIRTMRSLLESLGVSITTIDDHTWEIQAKEVRPRDLDPEICQKIRASILLAVL